MTTFVETREAKAGSITAEVSGPSSVLSTVPGARRGAIRGSWPINTQSAFTSAQPAATTCRYASASSSSESAPR